MLDKNDVRYWLNELEKHPETAADLVRMLADRLALLDKQNETLRGELIAAHRDNLRAGSTTEPRTSALEAQVQALQAMLPPSALHLIVFDQTRILYHAPADSLKPNPDRDWPSTANALFVPSGGALTILTPTTHVFQIGQANLPAVQDQPIAIGNPKQVTAIFDSSVFTRQRFLLLVSQRGYIYSALSASLAISAKKGEPLLRNLVPDDPIIAVVPSDNADVLCISHAGRWARFPQRSIEGVGSIALNLGKTDQFAQVCSLVSETILTFLTDDNRLFARQSAGLTAKKSPGHANSALFPSVHLTGVTTNSEFTLLTNHGQQIRMKAADVLRRATESGYSIPGLAVSERVIGMI